MHMVKSFYTGMFLLLFVFVKMKKHFLLKT